MTGAVTSSVERRAMGLVPLEIGRLHFDQVGGTAEIPDARIVVQADEWDAGHDRHQIERGVCDPADDELR